MAVANSHGKMMVQQHWKRHTCIQQQPWWTNHAKFFRQDEGDPFGAGLEKEASLRALHAQWGTAAMAPTSEELPVLVLECFMDKTPGGLLAFAEKPKTIMSESVESNA